MRAARAVTAVRLDGRLFVNAPPPPDPPPRVTRAPPRGLPGRTALPPFNAQTITVRNDKTAFIFYTCLFLT